MRRVSVVGNSGSGKSTLGRPLAAALGAEFLELDAINHQADWEPLPTGVFRRRVAAICGLSGCGARLRRGGSCAN
jgi:adenylate kinase family enzyme